MGARVRLLLVETESRALPFVPNCFGSFAHSLAVTSVADERFVVALSTAGDARLVVIARDVWNDDDTERPRTVSMAAA